MRKILAGLVLGLLVIGLWFTIFTLTSREGESHAFVGTLQKDTYPCGFQRIADTLSEEGIQFKKYSWTKDGVSCIAIIGDLDSMIGIAIGKDTEDAPKLVFYDKNTKTCFIQEGPDIEPMTISEETACAVIDIFWDNVDKGLIKAE